MGIEYGRELGVLCVLILMIILPVSLCTSSSRQNATAAAQHQHRPIYALGFSGLQQELWMNQLYTGAKDYEWTTGNLIAEWPLQLKTLCDIARGGTDFVSTIIAQANGRTLIIHNDQIYVNFVAGGGSEAVVDVDVASDGKTVVAAQRDGHTHLWTWNGHGFDARVVIINDLIDGLRISPDCRQILFILEGCRVAIWDCETGLLQKPFKAHDRRTSLIAWSPDQKSFATGGEDGMIRVWQAATGAMKWEAQGDTYTPSSLAWSPDGAEIAVGGFDQVIRTFETKTGLLTATLAGHQGAVRALAYEPHGTAIVSGDLHGDLLVWSTASKKVLRKL